MSCLRCADLHKGLLIETLNNKKSVWQISCIQSKETSKWNHDGHCSTKFSIQIVNTNNMINSISCCDDFKKKGTIRIKDNDVARLLKEKNQNGKYRDMFLLVTEASLREHTKGFGMRKCPKFTDMFHTMKRVLTQRTA